MEFAIKWIHDSLPEPMKIFISEDMIRNIVQKAFDQMTDFATKQLDKVIK